MRSSKIYSFIKQFFIRRSLIRQTGSKINAHSYISNDLQLGKNCVIEKNVQIRLNVKIGDNVKIGRNAILANISIGNSSHIESGVVVTGSKGGSISIGENSYIGINNILDHSNNIKIGNYVHIAGPSTGVWTHSSAKMCLNSVSIEEKDEKFRPTAAIVIEDNCYIGGNCTIYPGVTIISSSVIGPNSAVTKSTNKAGLYGGVPSKLIKEGV